MQQDTKAQIIAAIQTHRKMVDQLQATGIDTIAVAAQIIIESLNQDGRIYICGNGGSAADAQHIAGEFIGRFLRERKPLSAVALSTDTSVITAVANDYGYENTFVRQVEALVKKGDVLWVLSTSGSSENVVTAAQTAKNKQAKVIAFTGKDNSRLAQIADLCFCAAAESSPRSQEIHQVAYHIICDIVEQNCCGG